MAVPKELNVRNAQPLVSGLVAMVGKNATGEIEDEREEESMRHLGDGRRRDRRLCEIEDIAKLAEAEEARQRQSANQAGIGRK